MYYLFQMHYVIKGMQWRWGLEIYLFAMDVCDTEIQLHIGIVLNATKRTNIYEKKEFALTVSPKCNKSMVIHNYD